MNFIFSLYRQAFSNLHRNVWVLAATLFINRSGSMVLLFTSLYLTRELHFSISDAGIIMSFYGIGSVLGSYLGGWLTDRTNYFDIMVTSLIVCGLILLFMLVVKSFLLVSAVLFFYAITADAFRPANSASITVYSTPDNRTRSISLVRLAINLGFSVGPAIGGFIALYFGYSWLWVIDSFTSFAAAGMLWFYLPRKEKEISSKENSVLADSATSAYRDLRYLFFIFLVALYAVCFFQLFASVPQYFAHEYHYNEDTIGLLIALNGILVVLIEMPLILVLEKEKRIFRFIILGVSCIPVAFAVLMLGKGIMFFAIIYTLIITMAEIFAMPFMMNYALSKPPKERQGQYSALYSIAYGLGIIGAPSIGLGIAGRFGFNPMFYFFIVLSLMTAFGFWILSLRKK